MRLKQTLKTVVATAIMIIPGLVYAQAYGTVATETLNVRSGAKMDASIVEQIGLGAPVEIVSEQNDWLKIILEDDSRAYVKAEYINVHRALAVVEVNGGLNVRDFPSTEIGEVIGRFNPGDEISVSYRVGDWYKVSQEGFEGYVYRDYVKNNSQVDFLGYLPTKKITEVERATVTQEEALAETVDVVTGEIVENKETHNETNEKVERPSQNSHNNTGSSNNTSNNTSNNVPSNNSATATGTAIVNYAKQFLGNPYVYGGNSLTNGVDCSGFTSQVMRKFGVSLNRSSAAQYANNGYHVDRSNLQPGDLVFYGYSGKVSHVAIYMGGGQIIHANDERTGICISNAFPTRGKSYIGAKRVI